MPYAQSTSHDPKTDHRSPMALALVSLIVAIAIIGACTSNSVESVNPNTRLYTSIDGCTVYRFDDENGANYFAKCPKGDTATTSATGKHIITAKL